MFIGLVFLLFSFFLQKEHGKWNYRSKAKLANSSKVIFFQFLMFFLIAGSLLTRKTKRRCHTSSLDDCSILVDYFIQLLLWSLNHNQDFISALQILVCSSKGQKCEWWRQKRPISLQMLTFPSLHDCNREEMQNGLKRSKANLQLISLKMLTKDFA